ncbi:hypothetical protein [Streptomyces aureus]|nr:hypothetical protein [Streptomyces aureus]
MSRSQRDEGSPHLDQWRFFVADTSATAPVTTASDYLDARWSF